MWISFGADSTIGKIFGIVFPITLFVTSGFEHSIANMYYIPAAIFANMSFFIVVIMPFLCICADRCKDVS